MASPKRYFSKGEVYHIFNKSILGEKVFLKNSEAYRFLTLLKYYNTKNRIVSFSIFLRRNQRLVSKTSLLIPEQNAFVKFIAYCLMPDHYHLVVKVLEDNSLSYFIGKVENSFSRYFNTKRKRRGPLWQSRFKAVRVESNEQLLHLTRYVHLNPTSDGLIKKPEDWEWSSYREYISNDKVLREYLKEIELTEKEKYKKFVEERQDYQKRLKELRRLILEV